MNVLVSWPVARAATRERALAPLTLAIAAVLVLLAVVRGSLSAAEWFTGFSEFWLFLLTLLLGAGVLSEEVESGHAQLVLLRPLTRAQWVGGRFAAIALVLCAAGAAAWAASLLYALFRGALTDIGWRFALLPLALLPHLGWLATLVALGAVARGWTNAGLLIAVRFGWFLLRNGLPVAAPRLGLAPWLEMANHYFGPQEPFAEGGLRWERVAWDVLWIFAAWLAAVWLFNQRELARRRA